MAIIKLTDGEKIVTEEVNEEIKSFYDSNFGNNVIPYRNHFKHLLSEYMESTKFAIKLDTKLKKSLLQYLSNRPMAEVENFITMLETDDDKAYFTTPAIRHLNGYLMNKCPRKDVKRFIEWMANGGVEVYEIGDKKEN